MSNKFLLASKQESKFNLRKMDSFNSSPRGTNFTPMIGTSSKKTKKNLTELMEMSQQKHTPSKCHLCRFRTFWCKMQIPFPQNPTTSPKFDWDRCTLLWGADIWGSSWWGHCHSSALDDPHRYHTYSLVMTNSLLLKMTIEIISIEVVDFPITSWWFSIAMLNYQRVPCFWFYLRVELRCWSTYFASVM